jgi:hypothetical protein
MNENPSILELFFVKDNVIVFFDDYQIIIRLADISEKLLAASDFERSIYKISPSGQGVHWPILDEDISVNELVKKM